MAINALNSAATGLRALSTRIDVIANNLSNAETQAFKRERVNFEDLNYLQYKQPGITNGVGDVTPAGITVGLGTKISSTQLDFEQGAPEATGGDYDVAIQGEGFFRIKILDSINGGEGYTRNGNFFRNAKGQLVVAIGDGYVVQPEINLPEGATGIQIASDGAVQYTPRGAANGAKTTVGPLMLTQFVNPQGLTQQGGSIYTPTPASGPPLTSRPGSQGAGTLLQKFLESSNVDPVKELVSLIKTQRSFELNSQSIQTADQTLQTISNLRRG